MGRQLYPSFLDIVGRRVLVVGGGPVAAGKIPRLLEAGARVVVVAPALVRAIEQLPVEIERRGFEPADLDGTWYVVSAAPPDVNAAVLREAARRGIFVNAVDDPRHATAFAGSTVKRGPVTIAISTGGDAPALARVMREALEQLIGRDVEDWAALAATMRREWQRDRVPMDRRRGRLLAALAQLHEETDTADPPPAANAGGLVSLVGAGPGDPDLLTRKAARRLADADLVLYDALVPAGIVSIAKHAQLIFVGRRRGSPTMGQDAIIRALIRAARRGRRVVRLKGGDPFVFGRGGDEALALQAAGIRFEVVPGVSAALAAPAAASIPVTHRGVSGAVLITTGHDPERFARLVSSIEPAAVTLVVMMGTAHRHDIVDVLVRAGWRGSTPAAIIRHASLPEQTVWVGPLDELASTPDDAAPGTIVVGNVVAVRATLTGAWPAGQELSHA